MRILVAGATGSIGIHVVNTAIAMGHQPVTLVRNRRKIKLLPRGTDIFYGDVSIPETLTDLPKDIDAIIFTLGSDGQGRIGARAIDYGGVRNILRIFMDTPVRIALMTTIGVTERLSSWNQRTEVHDWKRRSERLVRASGHIWVNVKAIPAMEKDQKNENTLQLAIISRIKMFYRPTHLAMAPEEAPAMLRFRRSGSKLTLINPTPYFITVTNMKAGNSNLPNTMVPPKGEVSVDIPHAVTGDISFQTINDYGALTPRIKATMQ